MTAEIHAARKVLTIGGSSRRNSCRPIEMGLLRVLLPEDNEKELAEIPPDILYSLTMHLSRPWIEGADCGSGPQMPIEQPRLRP